MQATETSFKLIEASTKALDLEVARSGLNRHDVTNRALQVYSAIMRTSDADEAALNFDSPRADGTTERLTVRVWRGDMPLRLATPLARMDWAEAVALIFLVLCITTMVTIALIT